MNVKNYLKKEGDMASCSSPSSSSDKWEWKKSKASTNPSCDDSTLPSGEPTEQPQTMPAICVSSSQQILFRAMGIVLVLIVVGVVVSVVLIMVIMKDNGSSSPSSLPAVATLPPATPSPSSWSSSGTVGDYVHDGGFSFGGAPPYVPPACEPCLEYVTHSLSLLSSSSLDDEDKDAMAYPSRTQGLLNVPRTCQNWARDWLTNHPNITTTPSHRVRQRFVMALLYCEFNGDYWISTHADNNATLWISPDRHECEWELSSQRQTTTLCDDQDQVRYLALPQNRLRGTIPPEISMLRHLQALNLASNYITGDIPTELAEMRQLQSLDLSRNALQGKIPLFVLELQSLTHLDLAGNLFTGSILDQNNVNGTTTPVLRHLDLGNNNLSGIIPATFGDHDWEILRLQDNSLQGQVPTDIASLELKELLLHGNQLTGIGSANEVTLGQSNAERITLYNNGIWEDDGHEGLESMCRVVISSPSLESIEVDMDKASCSCCGPPRGQSNALPTPPDTDVCNTTDKNKFPRIITECPCTGSMTTLVSIEGYQQIRQIISKRIYQGKFEEPMDSCMPSNQALLWLATFPGGDAKDLEEDTDRLVDRYVLALMFFQLDGFHWTRNTNWLSDKDICSWHGIQCYSTTSLNQFSSAIRGVFLETNNLKGSMPWETVFLFNLQTLSLTGNPKIIGSMPADVCALRLFELTALLVDCEDTRTSDRSGLECSIPDCCTFCRKVPSKAVSVDGQ
uniref:Leucine-rich repeat-containing N-terminal plant-type domain-containing protein n=1 Tax=Amphora coffeiformis TaxID=265554 RepID=A0A7S3L766_9STRA|mmetsp:Transcript_14486/g.29292  ORF Transcript_14486/g.29292 Transcript_14486/m.29292 type:complete len:736 (+) Transcript_14486:94-2301(+)|eukprot:scaffold25842_cov198-Amphora_coffeaeformis.AAC.35